MQLSDGKGRYVRNPPFRQRSISLMQPGAGRSWGRRKSQMLQYVCVCLCASSCASYTIVTLILCSFADVTFRCDALDFPEGIETLNGETEAQKKSEAGWRVIFRLKSELRLSDSFLFSNDKDTCVTRSLSLFDAELVMKKSLVHSGYWGWKTNKHTEHSVLIFVLRAQRRWC